MTTRYLVCGGRDFADKTTLTRTLDVLIRHPADAIVIHGGARGADTMAADWAEARGARVQCFMADWDDQGRAAGPMRNRKMLMEGKPDVVIAFPGGKGTANMLKQANDLRLERNTYGGPPLIVIEVTA